MRRLLRKLLIRLPAALLLGSFALSGEAVASWQVLNHVTLAHGKLVIDHSKSVQEITQAQAQGGFKADLGVGLFQSRIKVELVLGELVMAGKRLSMSTHISTQPIIYIAREIPPNSCAYQMVLSHELMHQEYDLQVLRLLPDEIRQMTREVFSGDALEWSSAQSIENTLNRARARFFQQFNYLYQALGEMRHPIIDSPESYKNLSTLCHGELGQLLRPALAAGTLNRVLPK